MVSQESTDFDKNLKFVNEIFVKEIRKTTIKFDEETVYDIIPNIINNSNIGKHIKSFLQFPNKIVIENLQDILTNIIKHFIDLLENDNVYEDLLDLKIKIQFCVAINRLEKYDKN